MWDLIVSVPDHCLSFYFSCSSCNAIFNDIVVGNENVQCIASDL